MKDEDVLEALFRIYEIAILTGTEKEALEAREKIKNEVARLDRK